MFSLFRMDLSDEWSSRSALAAKPEANTVEGTFLHPNIFPKFNSVRKENEEGWERKGTEKK